MNHLEIVFGTSDIDITKEPFWSGKTNYYQQNIKQKLIVHRMSLLKKFNNMRSYSIFTKGKYREKVLQIKYRCEITSPDCYCGDCQGKENYHFENVGTLTKVKRVYSYQLYDTCGREKKFIAIKHLPYLKKLIVLSKLDKNVLNKIKISTFTSWIVWILNRLDRVYYYKYW